MAEPKHIPTFADPNIPEEQKQAWRAAGGRKRYAEDILHKPPVVPSYEGVAAGLRAVLEATWQQDNSGNRTRALIAGYRALLECLEAKAVVDAESILDELERAQAEQARMGDYDQEV